jgi:hypothetical protein
MVIRNAGLSGISRVRALESVFRAIVDKDQIIVSPFTKIRIEDQFNIKTIHTARS